MTFNNPSNASFSNMKYTMYLLTKKTSFNQIFKDYWCMKYITYFLVQLSVTRLEIAKPHTQISNFNILFNIITASNLIQK